MKKFKGIKDFLRNLTSLFGATRPAEAPENMADRVLSRISLGADLRQEWDWDLPPTLALSGAMAVFCLVLWQGNDHRPDTAQARILNFSADKTVVEPNEWVTFRYQVANAKKVFLRDPRGVMTEARLGKDTISVNVNLPGEYKFVLIALGNDGRMVSQPVQAAP